MLKITLNSTVSSFKQRHFLWKVTAPNTTLSKFLLLEGIN